MKRKIKACTLLQRRSLCIILNASRQPPHITYFIISPLVALRLIQGCFETKKIHKDSSALTKSEVVDKKLLALRCSYLQSGKKNPACERERLRSHTWPRVFKRDTCSAQRLFKKKKIKKGVPGAAGDGLTDRENVA